MSHFSLCWYPIGGLCESQLLCLQSRLLLTPLEKLQQTAQALEDLHPPTGLDWISRLLALALSSPTWCSHLGEGSSRWNLSLFSFSFLSLVLPSLSFFISFSTSLSVNGFQAQISKSSKKGQQKRFLFFFFSTFVNR